MEIQTVPIDDQINHSLDAMVEYGELDCGTYLAIILYADRGEVEDVFHVEDDDGWRTRVSARLTQMGDRITAALPIEKQGHLVWAAFNNACRNVSVIAPVLADWALTDSCEGGSMQPFKKKYRHLRDYRIPNKTRRRLYSRKWIRRYVKLSKETATLKELFVRVLRRMEQVPMKYVVDGEDYISRALEWQLYQTPIRPSRADTKLRGDEKKKRRVLKRSLRTASTIVPQPTLQAFIRREEISVTGKNLILRVRRTRSVLASGHGAFSVSVCDLDETHLANLCVYFEGTPVVDQLIGMMLYVSSGCEEEFVRAANLTYVTEAGRKHPLLADRVKPYNVPVEDGELRLLGRHLPFAVTRDRYNRYWEDTKAMWLEELAACVVGRKASKDLVDMYV